MTMPEGMRPDEVQAAWARLTDEVRTGVLLTLRASSVRLSSRQTGEAPDNVRPFGSHVPYVFGQDWTRAYLHLSRLALHTQHLLHDNRVSLFVSEPDGPGKNPLALRRMNLQGTAAVLPESHPEYPAAKDHYLARFPQSKMMFGFGDFSLWCLTLEDAHLVPGFGQAYQATASAPLAWIHQKPEAKKV
jgi:putative heme iron utilization protein